MWIVVRPGRREPVTGLLTVEITETGLTGDRHARDNARSVTLFQHEHLASIASYLGRDRIEPALLRRNIGIAGINLSALRGRHVVIGGAVVEVTGPCAPCSRMEEALGHGGHSAMRGHGGWCARVIRPGSVSRGDAVRPHS